MNVLILENLWKQNPEMVNAFKRLLATATPEQLPDIQMLGVFACERFDEVGQLHWLLRDFLATQPREHVPGVKSYWGLKHSATDMVGRIVATLGLPASPQKPLSE